MNYKKEISKFMYEKAIDGYKFIIERYKDWMNLYAIFTGAFFIAYYTLIYIEKYENLKILIIILGLITSVCWFYSFLGYYHWQISWIKMLQYHESLFLKLNINDKEIYNDYRVYSLFCKEVKKPLYSSQKIIKIFLFLIIIGWLILLFNPLKNKILNFIDIKLCCFICLYVFFILVLIFLIGYFFRQKCLSNTATMYELLYVDVNNNQYCVKAPEKYKR